MTRTETAQVKYTKWLKAIQCCLCFYQNLLNQLRWFYCIHKYFGHTEAIEFLLILRCIHYVWHIECVGLCMMIRESVFC